MRRTVPFLALAGLLAAAVAPRPSVAFKTFDFDQRYLVQPGFIVKDHSLVQAVGDTFHLFYIKADQSVPEGETAKSLGHATSMDLKHWTFRPDVIHTVPNSWEDTYIWAPHVVQASTDSMAPVYYMYYTGVNHVWSQQIGIAISNDLYNWSKSSLNPVYRPDTTWAAWSDTTYSNCRDSYVFYDNKDALWHMLTTAWTRNQQGALSHAVSTDLFDWTDVGPLLVHPGPQAWHVLESPQLHAVNGRYHLFFNEENVPSTSYLSSASLLGPWDYAQKVYFDAGRAIELNQFGTKWYLSRHAALPFLGSPFYVIKFDEMRWNTPSKPTVIQVGIEGWTRLPGGTAFAFQPTFWDNPLARGGAPSNFGGNSWIGTYERWTGPLQSGLPGDIAGDTPVGEIRTAPFTLTGNRIAFRIAGHADIDFEFLGLYTAADSVLRMASTGPEGGIETMAEQLWDVSAWTDSLVFLAIVDQSPKKHISVDEIREYYQAPVTDAGSAPPAPRATLYASTPNPFNPRTTIAFDLPRAGNVRLDLFDVRGRRLKRLVDALLPAGTHRYTWDGKLASGTAAASGTYLYRLFVDGEMVAARTATLVK